MATGRTAPVTPGQWPPPRADEATRSVAARVVAVASLLAMPLAYPLSWLWIGSPVVLQLLALGLAVLALRLASTTLERALGWIALLWSIATTLTIIGTVILVLWIFDAMNKGL